MKARKLILLVALAAIGSATQLTAATTVYTNQASFLSAVGSTPYFLNSFPDLTWFGYVGSSAWYSSSSAAVSYTLSSPAGIFATDQGQSDGAASVGQATALLQVTFNSTNVNAVGGNFFATDDNGLRTAGTVRIFLSDGTATNIVCPASPLPFTGFVSDGTAIASLSFSTLSGTVYPTVDNFIVMGGATNRSPLFVTATADSGPGSLRDAMNIANSQPGPDTIRFNIPGSGVQTIAPLASLPSITGPVAIDGYTQPGTSANTLTNGDDAVILIELSGTNAGAADGLYLAAINILVRGLSIVSWGRRGVAIQSPGRDQIEGNFIGVRPDGVTLGSNIWNAVNIDGAPDNTVGGTTPAARNILSGSGRGVNIGNSGATGNVVSGNFVGTDKTGTLPVSNGDFGIAITAASDNQILGNVISGNRSGILLWQPAATRNRIEGNYIGTDVTGTHNLSNAWWGITFDNAATNTIGGPSRAQRNIIAGNGLDGISMGNPSAVGNVVLGNFIGTDVTGSNALPNGSGINIGAANNIVGGAGPGARNLVSGNRGNGIYVGGASTTNVAILGNYIGTDGTGTNALGNADGIIVSGAPNNFVGGATPGAGNVVSGNRSGGIGVHGDTARGNLIQGNLVGTDATGFKALGNRFSGITFRSASANTVGGSVTGARNVISANGLGGVQFHNTGFSNNIVQGNFIGADITGTNALGNHEDGILLWAGTDNLIGGSAPGAGNVIVGNRRYGITVYLGAQRTRILGNSFGTDLTGTRALGNSGPGIIISDAYNSMVGGIAAGEANTVAFNGGVGIQIGSGTNNALRANSIYANGSLGIDLNGNGVTPNDLNDTDTGGNQLQNYPVLSAAVTTGATVIQGTLSSTTNTPFQLDFFANTTPDSTGYGEGQTYLGSSTATTGARGTVSFSFTPATPIPIGKWITATATNPWGNTSEFSRVLRVSGPPVFTPGTIRFTNGTFSASLLCASGTSPQLVIEVSTNLQAWFPLTTNTTAGGVLPFSDPDAGSSPQRFYRALVQ